MRSMLKIRGLSFVPALSLLSLPAMLVAQAPQWKPYPFPADGFTASFPSKPEVEKQTINSDAGPLEIRTYTAEDSGVGLIIAVCDYGAGAAGKDPDTLLDSAKQGAVSNIKGRLISEKKITLEANHGVAFEAENDSAHLSARIYLVGTTLYQVIVAAPLQTPYAESARFLDSLQLAPRPHTEAAAAPPPAADWKTYPYPADGFSASFPSQPRFEKQNIPTDAGTVEYHSYTADDNSSALIAGITNFGATLAGKDPGVILQGAKKGAVTNSKGKLVSEKSITLGNNPGIEFVIDSDSARVTARVYLVGTSIYEMIVASPQQANYAEVTRFLDSLQLIDRAGK